MTKAKPLPSIDLLQSILSYDNETGVLCWKINAGNKRVAGKPAGYTNSKGYIQITINNKEYQAHRIVWFIVTGRDPRQAQIDHINGIKNDNRFCNLRLATNSNNACNKGISARNSSGFKGVSYSKARRKWRASIRINRKEMYLGSFETPERAHMAYCKAAAELHGEFARGA